MTKIIPSLFKNNFSSYSRDKISSQPFFLLPLKRRRKKVSATVTLFYFRFHPGFFQLDSCGTEMKIPSNWFSPLSQNIQPQRQARCRCVRPNEQSFFFLLRFFLTILSIENGLALFSTNIKKLVALFKSDDKSFPRIFAYLIFKLP